MKGAPILLLCVLCVHLAQAEIGAVLASIPFAGSYGDSIEQNTLASLKKAALVIEEAKSSGNTLVVFPEGMFWWFLPTTELALEHASTFVKVVDSKTNDDGEAVNPCLNNSTELIGRLSCLGREYGMNFVVNMATKSCAAEAEAERTSDENNNNNNDKNNDNSDNNIVSSCKLWNTAVAISEKGALLATYRKSHEYGSNPKFDTLPTSEFDVSWFSLNGLKLGLLVCFDIEFAEPAQSLMASGVDVDAIAVPMYWVNTPPLSWSVLYQQAFSRLHPHVTVLYSNDAQSAQTWGNAAFRGGDVLVGSPVSESFGTDDDAPYEQLISVSVPTKPANQTNQAKTEDSQQSKNINNIDNSSRSSSSSRSDIGDERNKGNEGESFPCFLPSYGTGTCVTLSGPPASVRVAHGAADCQVRHTGLRLNNTNNTDSVAVVAVALDQVIAGEETVQPLRVLVCAVLACSFTAGEGGEVRACEAQYHSYSVLGVENREEEGEGSDSDLFKGGDASLLQVSMKGYRDTSFSGDRPTNVGIINKDLDVFQVMPLAADAAFHSLPTHYTTYAQDCNVGRLDVHEEVEVGAVTLIAIQQ